MSTSIENLDINALQQLKQQADELIAKKQREQVDAAYQQIVDIAIAVGLSLDELVEHGQKNKKTTIKRSVAPRYRNPNDKNQTWTGRGKQPRWVVDLITAGKALDDLLI